MSDEPGVYTPSENQILQATGPIKKKIEKMEQLFADRLDTLNDLVSHAMHRMDNIEAPPPPPDRAELYAALAKAQGEIQAAEANKEAEIRKKDDYSVVLYTFKYADLAACLEVIRKPLSDNELALIQIPSLGENNEVHMRTVLGHRSGQTISCEMTMVPEKSGPQAIGTCMSYLRRYSLCAMLGVAQFDDDAASATKSEGDYDRLSPRDIDELLVKADELFGEEQAEGVLQFMVETVFEKKHLGEIPKDQLKFALQRLDNKKKKDDEKAAKLAADEKKATEEKPNKKPPTTKSKEEPGADG